MQPATGPGAVTPGTLPYCPQTDLRYCGLGMVAKAVAHFQAGVVDGQPLPWLESLVAEAGGTVGDLARGCDILASALVRTLESPEVDLNAELLAGGFRDLPIGIQQAIAAQIGRMALGMTIVAVRDSTPVAAFDHEAAIARLVEAAAGLARESRPRNLPFSRRLRRAWATIVSPTGGPSGA